MKYIYSLLFIISGFSAFSQFSYTIGYALGVPKEQMASNINPSHGLSTGLMYQLPGALSRVQAGMEFGYSTYASTRKEQTFNFGNGTSTRTWVNYSSNVVQANLVSRIMILQDKKILPYISGKAGYTSFFSNIYIEDPHDPGGCKALDKKNLIKDGTFSAGYGGGIQLDWSLFSKKVEKGRRYIDIGVNKVSGRNIDYINTKKLIDAANPPVGTNGKPLTVRFINATTQEIHEHQVAEVYNSPLRLIEFKINAVFYFNAGRR
jgi:hypothetical protein